MRARRPRYEKGAGLAPASALTCTAGVLARICFLLPRLRGNWREATEGALLNHVAGKPNPGTLDRSAGLF